METIKSLFDFILHIDVHLAQIISQYQTTSYAILFLIIFCETGLVFTPLLPGDSLLFATGALIATAASSVLNIWIVIPLLMLAALLGDNVNYFVGNKIGPKLISKPNKFFKREYLDKTQSYFEKHGGKTIIIARFIPIVRTFAPFVAGLGSMTYSRFILFCISGAVLWVPTLTLAGYYFGQHPFVKKNFELVVFGIIGFSLLPVIIGLLKAKFNKN
jgi:membrane-associated protein